VGVGLMEGFQKGVNWRMFAKQFASWVSTLFVVGLAVAAIFAQVGTCRVWPWSRLLARAPLPALQLPGWLVWMLLM